ncbi:MAG: MASE1 domain-containing protein [Pseudomonadota bacterium]|nr:MASE1 domain-containing protein [Pseudomonadota bacterium]
MTDFAAPSFPVPPSASARVRNFARLGLVYLAAYLALNWITNQRGVGGSPITLWSPDDALSVMLIMESWVFAPILCVARIAADQLFHRQPHSFYGTIVCDTILVVGYLGIALTLRGKFGLQIRSMRPRDLIAVLVVAPLGSAIIGVVYCGALIAVGAMPASEFLSSYAGFWIGDAAAMVVIIPATCSIFRVFSAEPWRQPVSGRALILFAGTMLFVGAVILVSASSLKTRYLFNLAFLPILTIGMKFGYDAGALTLLILQILLLVALDYFDVRDQDFATYQILMFALAVSGQALGAMVTEWETATAQLRRQQADLAKVSERATNGAMAAAMSHEISQPLASIAAYLLGARRLLESGNGQDKALGALRKAEGEAARARKIIERLRDFVAKGEVAREWVDLGDLAGVILRLQTDAASERGVTLRLNASDEGPLRARIDRVGVEQALANLVLNAIEAAPARTGVVAIALARRGAMAVLSVQDNGRGVATEIAERLFEPFETTKPRGMGLGLPLAKEIAAQHGGRLNWRPVAPQGARFELELPLA